MGKIMGLLVGAAGGIAGLLPYVPVILAVVAALGAGGWGLWQTHEAQVAKDATVTVQQKLDAANQNLGVDSGVIATQTATISDLQANEKANDALIADYQHTADEDARLSADAGSQIRKLQDDPAVAAYLRTPIPASLLGVLNNGGSAARDAVGSGDQDAGAAAAKAK